MFSSPFLPFVFRRCGFSSCQAGRADCWTEQHQEARRLPGEVQLQWNRLAQVKSQYSNMWYISFIHPLIIIGKNKAVFDNVIESNLDKQPSPLVSQLLLTSCSSEQKITLNEFQLYLIEKVDNTLVSVWWVWSCSQETISLTKRLEAGGNS